MHFAALRGDLKQARTLALHCQTLLSAYVVRTLQVKLLEKTSSLSLDDAGYFHFACRSGDLPTVQYIFGKFVSPAARLKAINNGILPERLYKEYPILRITPVQWAAAQVHRIATGRFPSSCVSLHLQDAPVFSNRGTSMFCGFCSKRAVRLMPDTQKTARGRMHCLSASLQSGAI
jgi:hypothetical protein